MQITTILGFFVTILLVLFLKCEFCIAYKILMMPLPVGKSHVLSMVPIGNEMTKRGHTVHILLGHGFALPTQQEKTLKVIYYGSPATDQVMDYDVIQENLTRSLLEKKSNMIAMWPQIMKMGNEESRRLLVDNEDLLVQLESEKFDIAIVDSIYFMKYAYLIPLRLNVPWVTYTDVMPAWIVRVPYLPSFVPGPLTLYTEKMTFIERLINTVLTITFSTFIAMPDPPNEVLAKYKKYGKFSTMDDLISKSLLFISTTDIVLDYPTPSMPNIIEAGGLTVSPSDENDLPDNLKQFMFGAKNGIILVTFGSVVSSLPNDIALKFISAFKLLGPLGYRIVWKLNNKDNLVIPDNVLVSHWLPQNNILASKTVKLFITHCGKNGQFEAVYHGVPMLGFPFIGDQPYNARRFTYKGYGISMDVHSFTAKEFYRNIMIILSEKSFHDHIKRASEIFKSSPETPAEKAARWIEHVTRFGGEHLRSAGSDLYVYQYLMLDILFVAIVIVFLLYCGLSSFMKFLCKKVHKTSVKSSKKRN